MAASEQTKQLGLSLRESVGLLIRRPVRAWLLGRVGVPPEPRSSGGRQRVYILLGSAWGMGGTIRAAHNLAGYLAKDYDVVILSVFRRREKPFFDFPPGVKVVALDDQRRSARVPARLRPVRALLRLLPSVFMDPSDRSAPHTSLWFDLRLVETLAGQSGYLIGTRPGLNIVVAELSPPGLVTIGQEQINFRTWGKPLKEAMRRTYPRLDGFAVLTKQDHKAYRKFLGEPGKDVRFARIPNTVRAVEGPKADLDAKVVLAAGRLTRQKGFDLLIEAWAGVAAKHPDWRLRICGGGSDGKALRKQAAGLGIADMVELPGPKDLTEEFAASSIFVLSSRFEGFPLVLLEAMSFGTAPIAYDCPTGPADIIDDHRNGLLVPAKDVEGLTAAIVEMIEDEELRRRCAAAALETVADFTIDVVGRQWETFLAELSGSAGESPSPVATSASR